MNMPSSPTASVLELIGVSVLTAFLFAEHVALGLFGIATLVVIALDMTRGTRMTAGRQRTAQGEGASKVHRPSQPLDRGFSQIFLAESFPDSFSPSRRPNERRADRPTG